MLEYAANGLSFWKLEAIRARFEASCDYEPEQVLSEAIGEEVDCEAFWERVETNLKAGRIRLMFVGDSIPSELRAIVEFLNQHMPLVEVLALELKQYVDADGDHQTLVPRLIGETEAARQAKGRPERASWDRDSWLGRFRGSRPETETRVVERLLAWADEHHPPLTPRFGKSVKNPGAKLWLGDTAAPFTIYPGFTQWYTEVGFAGLARTPPFDSIEMRRGLQQRLTAIPGVAIPDERLDKFPTIYISAFVDATSYETFISAIEWAIEQIKDARANV